MSFADRAVELAAEAATLCGLDPADARVLRVASAVTVELPRAAAIARVEASDALSGARRQVIAARILKQRGVAAARLVAADGQPVALPDGVVTLWRRLRLLAGQPDVEALGRIARQLHAACADELPAETPTLDPLAPIPGWLDRAGELGPLPATGELWRRLERLRAAWPPAVAADPLGTALVHGDFHVDNVVLTADGPTLLDLETAGLGPVSWDLLTQELQVRRYGAPASDYRRFCAAYGVEPPDWQGADVLRQTYELHLVAWAVGHRDRSPALAEQAPLRLAGFLGHGDDPWTLI